jgi:serine/threonine-protein phosphatase 2A regulatory subunit A
MSGEENGLSLLKMELQNEEIHIKVNAIHRLKTVILSIGKEDTVSILIPYIDELIKTEDDEVLFAVAEELGNVFTLIPDKTVFLPSLEALAKHDETVVRDQAAKSLVTICAVLSEAEIQNVFAPLVVKLAQGEWFTGRVSSSSLFYACYSKAGPQKEKLRKKFIELCNEDTPMIRRACASRLGDFATQLEKQHVLQEILPIFR